MNFINFRPNCRKRRGDAVILLSVLVSGLVILVSAIAAQNLKKSARIQGVQKRSLISTYKAESGIEYGLLVAKNSLSSLNQNANGQFQINVWKRNPATNNFDNVNTNAAAVSLAVQTPKDSIVLSSKNETAGGEEETKKVLISNVPNSFPNQAVLWNNMKGCEDLSRCPADDPETGNEKISYQLAVPLSVFDTEGISNPQYRLVFRCQGTVNCRMGTMVGGYLEKKIKLKYSGSSAACDFSQCAFSCESEAVKELSLRYYSDAVAGMDIPKTISTEWFTLDAILSQKSVVVEFDVEEASKGVEEIKLPSSITQFDGSIKICKKKGSDTYKDYTDRRAGLVKVVVRKGR
ncbi:MAG: hypothetical protein FJZ04_01730 [Candidatus Moranbacteria bacterium]|nr:hypothetical protein [Candidatus Moranbacteria bacterium]